MTSTESDYVYEEAKKLRDEKEAVYGDAWKMLDIKSCFEQIPRKTNYLVVQFRNGRYNTHKEKFREDILDLINWCVFTYSKLEVKK